MRIVVRRKERPARVSAKAHQEWARRKEHKPAKRPKLRVMNDAVKAKWARVLTVASRHGVLTVLRGTYSRSPSPSRYGDQRFPRLTPDSPLQESSSFHSLRMRAKRRSTVVSTQPSFS